jgi:hypothetical protein
MSPEAMDDLIRRAEDGETFHKVLATFEHPSRESIWECYPCKTQWTYDGRHPW